MKWYHWALAGALVYVLLCAACLIYAVWKRGTMRAWRCAWMGQCDPQWMWNEHEMVKSVFGGLRPTYRWLGVYRCRYCGTGSYGAARHEQATREVKGEPADWGTA